MPIMKDDIPSIDDIASFEEMQCEFECVSCGGTKYKLLRKKRRVRNLILTTVVCLKCGEKYGIPEEVL